jgi:hypothetical protein
MATTRIKDLSKTATTVASDANIVIDGSSNGTQKITRDNFRQDTADAYVAAPSTYKLAPLNGVNKIDAAYLPTSGDTPKGEWNASTNSPTLADGTGTAGDYYDVTTAGTANLGSEAITYTVGDVVKYNGATWFKIDSVANILDGISTVDPAKAALQIPNVGTAANEVSVNGMLGDMSFQNSAGVVVDDLTVDGQLTAAVGKPMPVNGPSMRFDGVNDYVSFADNDAFSFTNGTDDLPFSFSAWVKMEDATSFRVFSKYGGSSNLREYYFGTDTSDTLRLYIRDSASQSPTIVSDVALTGYENEWIHIAATYGGAGPTAASGAAFSSSMTSNAALYVNGKEVASTPSDIGSYAGMSNTSQPAEIGRVDPHYTKGEIRDVKIYNKELSLAEVKEVYSNGQLPESFAESTGTANLVTNGDFSSGSGWVTDSDWTVGSGVATTTGAASNYLYQTGVAVNGKRNRLSFEFTRTSGSGNIIAYYYDTAYRTIAIDSTNASGTATGEFISPANGNIYFRATSGWAGTIDNVRVTQIGSVLDARAENYNQSAGKLLDVSGNDFVGDQSGGVELLTPRSHLSAGTLDLTNLPTSATGLSAGEVYNDSGTLKIV